MHNDYKAKAVFLSFLLLTLFSIQHLSAQDVFSGNVFLDHNSDGTKNFRDYNHPAIMIRAYDDTNNSGAFDTGDLLLTSDLTDQNGNYSLTLPVGSTVTKSQFVQTENDDAEEFVADSSMYLASSDLEMAFEDGTDQQIVGIRFDGIDIPAGVTITNAYIEFEAKADNAEDTDLYILGEKNIASARFSSTKGNISSRITTTDTVKWEPLEWDDGVFYQTPNLATLITELNSMSGWSESSPITFMISGTGEREAWSAEESGTAPRLVVEYDNPSSGNGYFIVLESSELLPDSDITLPGTEYYTYNTGVGTISNVDFAFFGQTLLCYGMSDGGANSGLSAMNRVTGENFLIGLSGQNAIEAACFDPYSSALYAADADQLGIINRTTGVFTATSNTFGTGSSTALGANENFNDVDGLAFDPITGILWGTERKDSWDALFQINHTTGAFIPDAFGPGEDYVLVQDAGGTIPGDIDDIAIDPEDGTLYGIANNPNFDLLVSIDKTTGIATAIDTLKKVDGNYVVDVEGFGFTNFGLLLAVTGNSSSLDDSQWNINLETASAEYVGTYNYGEDYESCDCLTAAINNVSGTVFNDVDGDGNIDVGDNGLQSVTVYIYIDDNNDGRIDNNDIIVDSVDTDATGLWGYDIASNVDLLFRIDENDLPVGALMTTNNLEMAFLDNGIGGQFDPNNNFGYNFTGPDTDKDGIADSSDIDDDNDGIPDAVENYSGDHDNDGTPDYEDSDFCALYFEGVNSWTCTNGIPDPSDDLDSDGLRNFKDADFPYCGGLNAFNICSNYDKDNDGIPDHIDLDADNDGIPDLIEAKGADTDGDGRVDDNTDTDGDGLADVFDNNDTDGPTGDNSDVVNPSTTALLDANSDGTTDAGDTDGDGLPDYIDLDADNDGIPDLVEAGGIDTNGDGRVDHTIDDDGDGYSDIYDSDEDDIAGDEDGGTPLVETDISKNLLHGATGNSIDTDGDGFADHLDLDADNDGIPDIVEAGGTTINGDGMVDTGALPWDSDNDGLADIYDENAADGPGTAGLNGTSLIKTTADSNNDYRVNSTESMQAGGTNFINIDGDPYPNHLDLDADIDGITDVVENASGNTDADNGGSGNLDGVIDNYTDSADDNGWNDSSNSSTTDTDGDGIPDYLDIDADNDGIPDYIESVCTLCPSAAGPSGADTDGNGVLDIFENMSADNTNNSSGSHVGATPNKDDDDSTDMIPDYLDTDTDKDGAYDWTEGFNLTNSTGAVDDIINIAIAYEASNSSPNHYNTTDTDNDGLPDWLDNQPTTSGYDETVRPPLLNQSSIFWQDANNNGLADLFDPAMNGTLSTTPDADGINDDDWRDQTTLAFLPVELVEFKTTVEDCSVLLSWRTAAEDNFSHFEIQRSIDGQQFKSLTSVYSKGEVEGSQYTYVDDTIDGLFYYRLKIMDLDGSFEFSKIITASTNCEEGQQNIKVYPNPLVATNDLLNIMSAQKSQGAEIKIFNAEGKLVYAQTIEGTAVSIDLRSLNPGIYFIQSIEGQYRFMEKLIIH